MDIYLSSNTVNAAWMAHYGGIDGIIWAQLANELVPGITMGILPDIVLDRNNPPTAIKGDAYHEMTHASHFTQVGSNWWQHLTKFEFDHSGHGNNAAQNDPDAGYCAVAESWTDHIGDEFDDISSGNLPNNESLISERGTNWIPEGIYYDLFDVNTGGALEPPGPLPFLTIINDNISGFSNLKIFDVLDVHVTSIPELRQRLWNQHGFDPQIIGTPMDYTNLFNSYGY